MSGIDKSELETILLQCCAIVQSVLFLLKLFGVLDMEWYAVFFPSYVAAGIVIFVAVLSIIAYAIISKQLKKDGYNKEDIKKVVKKIIEGNKNARNK